MLTLPSAAEALSARAKKAKRKSAQRLRGVLGPAAVHDAGHVTSIVTKGALVLDALLLGAVGERKVIWRGMAQSTLDDSEGRGP
jgi:hypothetical protein